MWLRAVILLSFYTFSCKYLPLPADPGGMLSDKLGGRQGLVCFFNILNQKRTKYTTQKIKEINLQTILLTLVLLRYLRQGSFLTTPSPLVGRMLKILGGLLIKCMRKSFSIRNKQVY